MSSLVRVHPKMNRKPTSTPSRDQEKFYSVYRGRQGGLFHLAYMRSAKVKAAKYLLERNGVRLEDCSVFDYGFGAGTFFRACATSCRIAGVEIDQQNVEAVRRMLVQRGFRHQDIRALDVADWHDHPLLRPGAGYDVVLVSHVLEHLDHPVELLRTLHSTLAPNGVVIGLLPTNEIRPDPDHKWICNRDLVSGWALGAKFVVADYAEIDHFVYYALPILQASGKVGRLLAQALSLMLGLAQATLPPSVWFSLGTLLKVVGARPGQIAFMLRSR